MHRLIVLGTALLAATACGRVNLERRDADRYLRATDASVRTLSVWFGAAQPQTIDIVNASARHAWRSTRTSMAPELAAARAVARQYWTRQIDSRSLPTNVVEGLIEYSARRSVEPLFQGENQEPGYAMLEMRAFGGLVPIPTRLRLMPETGDRTIRTLNTLERWVSRPVLDGALGDFIAAARNRTPTLGDLEQTISNAAGQDLSWLFGQTLDGSAQFDYAVGELSIARNGSGRFVTTMLVERRGSGIFPGTAEPRVGPFDSGAGVELRVTFDDGSEIRDRWDGRDLRRAFVYEGPSAGVSATIDPERLIALDVDRTNNSRTLRPRSSTAAVRWAARWSLWLENLLLTYAFFV
jgi:hypothetical protein